MGTTGLYMAVAAAVSLTVVVGLTFLLQPAAAPAAALNPSQNRSAINSQIEDGGSTWLHYKYMANYIERENYTNAHNSRDRENGRDAENYLHTNSAYKPNVEDGETSKPRSPFIVTQEKAKYNDTVKRPKIEQALLLQVLENQGGNNKRKKLLGHANATELLDGQTTEQEQVEEAVESDDNDAAIIKDKSSNFDGNDSDGFDAEELHDQANDANEIDDDDDEHWPDPVTPPVWPPVFTADFVEMVVNKVSIVVNNGTWYYNFPDRIARFDHYDGQHNNFCQGQGLSPDNPYADCHLMFLKSGDMWVIYPGSRDCCRLCDPGEGCTILKPDWLQGGTYIGNEDIAGRECAGWAKQGEVAAADTWFQDSGGVPCRYHEIVFGVRHNLTFVPSSYTTEPIDPRVFDLPDYCVKKCPNPFLQTAP